MFVEIKKIISDAFFSSYGISIDFKVEKPLNSKFGDVSSNIALVSSKYLRTSPRVIAENLVKSLSNNDFFENIEIAGPGFINFFLSSSYYQESIQNVLDKKLDFANLNEGQNRKIQLEFVSANPTGPLTLAHARQAVMGNTLANTFSSLGYKVIREYYFNDAGNQMNLLAKSLWVRYNQLFDKPYELPENGYQGEYLIDYAKEIKNLRGNVYVDVWNDRVKYEFLEFAKNKIMDWIKKDLKKIGVSFEVWFSERSLHDSGEVEKVLKILKDKGLTYEKDGALWFKSSDFFDDKDRVLIKSDGSYTYVTPDIAYHYNKFMRGFDWVLDFLGPDHHGYIPRMKSAMKALDIPDGFLRYLIHQYVMLYKDGQEIKMSTRKAQYLTLSELVDMIGKDAAIFYLASVSPDRNLSIDIDLAKKKSSENPVYYVQYAAARINGILRKSNLTAKLDVSLLNTESERELINLILILPDILLQTASTLSTNVLTEYSKNLASAFHKFYNKNSVITEDKDLSSSRLALIESVLIVLKKVFSILGVSIPEKM
jgi:arginyl-tRNA synthetase